MNEIPTFVCHFKKKLRKIALSQKLENSATYFKSNYDTILAYLYPLQKKRIQF